VKAAASKRQKTATAAAAAAAAAASSKTATVMTADSQYCSMIGMKLAASVKRNQITVHSNDGSSTAGDAATVSQLLLTLLQQQQLLPAGVTVEVDVKNGYMNFDTVNMQCDDAAVLAYYHDSSSSSNTSSATLAAAAVSSSDRAISDNSNTQQQQYTDSATAATLTAAVDSSRLNAMDTLDNDTIQADDADMMHIASTNDMQIRSDTTGDTLLQFNGLTGSSNMVSAHDRDRMMSIDQSQGDDSKHTIHNSSAISSSIGSSADTTVYGLPKHKYKGQHQLTITTIPAQFTQEVYEVM
jgi:hypothetical protein